MLKPFSGATVAHPSAVGKILLKPFYQRVVGPTTWVATRQPVLEGCSGMAKRTTLADVAARAGLSTTAVSLILNERPGSRLSPEAVERVRTAAQELNYRPNPAARTLRMGTTRTIGFVSDEVTITRYASAMIRGALDVAEENDHAVLMVETHSSPEAFVKAFSLISDRRTDALVVASMAARQLPIPATPPDLSVVTLNCTSPRPTPSVLPDEYHAGYEVANALLAAGHRRIGVLGRDLQAVSDPSESVTVPSRQGGIRAAFDDAGCEPAAVASLPNWDPDVGYAGMRQLLHDAPELTAVLCLNDRLAFGAYQYLSDAHLRVPDDVSVASFDDDVLASYLRPGLTTARIPYEEMGRAAMELCLGGSAEPVTTLVPMPLTRRASIGPPR